MKRPAPKTLCEVFAEAEIVSKPMKNEQRPPSCMTWMAPLTPQERLQVTLAVLNGTTYPGMMEGYLPEAAVFVGMERRKPDGLRSILCPKCRGYGGWVYKINAYPTNPGTRELRDFRSGCPQCQGWGYVQPGTPDANCVHEYSTATHEQIKSAGYTLGSHDHAVICTKCSRILITDSSD
jgi:hypothetical protein